MKMRKYFATLVVITCGLVSCTKESTQPATIIEAENSTEIEQELLNTVNEHRVSIGKNVLQFDTSVYTHANAHTDYMIAKGAISHDNFTARASAISKETAAEFVAENVAKDYANATQAFQGWLNSTNHKRTMEGEFTHTAVSVKKDDRGNLYFTQIFYR